MYLRFAVPCRTAASSPPPCRRSTVSSGAPPKERLRSALAATHAGNSSAIPADVRFLVLPRGKGGEKVAVPPALASRVEVSWLSR